MRFVALLRSGSQGGQDEVVWISRRHGKVGVKIGGQDGRDFRVHGLIVRPNSLVLEQFQPLPRPLFVWKGAGKVAGKIIDLASFLDGIGVFERCVELSRTIKELSSGSNVDRLDLPVRNGPVLRKPGLAALDPPSCHLSEGGNKGHENIVEGYPGMKGVPLNPFEYFDNVGNIEQSGTSAGKYVPRYDKNGQRMR